MKKQKVMRMITQKNKKIKGIKKSKNPQNGDEE